MRIIKKERVAASSGQDGQLTTELVEVVTDRQRAEQQRESLRHQLAGDILRNRIRRLEQKVNIQAEELGRCAGTIATAEEAAHARGVQEGIEQGIRQGKAAADELLHTLRDLVAEARLHRQELIIGSGGQVIELATGMARLLVGEVFEQRPQTLVDIIEKVLDEYSNAAPFTITLNPLDLEMIRQEGYIERLTEVKVELVEAAEIPRHQCRVEMAQGLVELGEQQLDVMGRVLREQLEVEK